jgi:hypothetical protein
MGGAQIEEFGPFTDDGTNREFLINFGYAIRESFEQLEKDIDCSSFKTFNEDGTFFSRTPTEEEFARAMSGCSIGVQASLPGCCFVSLAGSMKVTFRGKNGLRKTIGGLSPSHFDAGFGCNAEKWTSLGLSFLSEKQKEVVLAEKKAALAERGAPKSNPREVFHRRCFFYHKKETDMLISIESTGASMALNKHRGPGFQIPNVDAMHSIFKKEAPSKLTGDRPNVILATWRKAPQ